MSLADECSDSGFVFVDDPTAFQTTDACVVRIPPGGLGKKQLLSLIARQLNLPSYFGHNWDALEECLRDLSWLPPHASVVIVHEDVPFPANEQALAIYVWLLQSVVREHVHRGDCCVRVVFPTHAKLRVAALLARE